MRRVCSWCSSEMGEVGSDSSETRSITHGICIPCAKDLLKDLGKPLKNFLDTFDAPILLIGPDPKVLTANTAALSLLGKNLVEIEGYKGGEVINCKYAYSENGCGNDVHCESCTIRNTVLETFVTGKSFHEVQAYSDIQQVETVKTYDVRISTEKVGQVVLLRIDHFAEASGQARISN